jgi:hypothetical protein
MSRKPSELQYRVAEAIIENSQLDKPKSDAEMLLDVGYAETTAYHKQKEIIQSEGVQEALQDFGFTEENAKRVVANIMLNDGSRDENRLKAAGMVFDVFGSAAPKKTLNLNLNADVKQLDPVTDEYEEKLKQRILDKHAPP